LVATLLVIFVTLALPYASIATLLGFAPVPLPVLLIIAGIVVAYVALAEWLKTTFYRKIAT
jgi:hypothetical protein